jgi:hypothetical protein
MGKFYDFRFHGSERSKREAGETRRIKSQNSPFKTEPRRAPRGLIDIPLMEAPEKRASDKEMKKLKLIY